VGLFKLVLFAWSWKVFMEDNSLCVLGCVWRTLRC